MNKASRVKVKMKTVSPNIMIGCLLAAFVPCVISATIPSNSDREMKLNVALQKRDQYVPKRSLDNSVELLDEKENKNMGTPISPDSDHLSGRGKRACHLLTCSVHDLAYRISQLSNKKNNAPNHSISPCGYGRRRRRSLLQCSPAQTHGKGSLRHDSPQKLT